MLRVKETASGTKHAGDLEVGDFFLDVDNDLCLVISDGDRNCGQSVVCFCSEVPCKRTKDPEEISVIRVVPRNEIEVLP